MTTVERIVKTAAKMGVKLAPRDIRNLAREYISNRAEMDSQAARTNLRASLSMMRNASAWDALTARVHSSPVE